MSATWAVILGSALATFAIKAAGPVALGGRELPGAFNRVIALLAPALLSALIVTSALADGDEIKIGADTAGVAAGALVVWRTKSVVGSVIAAAAVTARAAGALSAATACSRKAVHVRAARPSREADRHHAAGERDECDLASAGGAAGRQRRIELLGRHQVERPADTIEAPRGRLEPRAVRAPPGVYAQRRLVHRRVAQRQRRAGGAAQLGVGGAGIAGHRARQPLRHGHQRARGRAARTSSATTNDDRRSSQRPSQGAIRSVSPQPMQAETVRGTRATIRTSGVITLRPVRGLRIGVQLPEVERVVRWPEYVAMARAAEEVGFDSIWIGDHLLTTRRSAARGRPGR